LHALTHKRHWSGIQVKVHQQGVTAAADKTTDHVNRLKENKGDGNERKNNKNEEERESMNEAKGITRNKWKQSKRWKWRGEKMTPDYVNSLEGREFEWERWRTAEGMRKGENEKEQGGRRAKGRKRENDKSKNERNGVGWSNEVIEFCSMHSNLFSKIALHSNLS